MNEKSQNPSESASTEKPSAAAPLPASGAGTGSRLDRLFLQSELCSILRTSSSTMSDWRKKGLPSYFIGKKVWFDAEELFDWIKNNRKV